jgi:hypothetical protein
LPTPAKNPRNFREKAASLFKDDEIISQTNDFQVTPLGGTIHNFAPTSRKIRFTDHYKRRGGSSLNASELKN